MNEENKTSQENKSFFRKVGGRKSFHGYIAVVFLTVMAFFLNATYPMYMSGILLALGITSGLTTTEDVLRDKGERR